MSDIIIQTLSYDLCLTIPSSNKSYFPHNQVKTSMNLRSTEKEIISLIFYKYTKDNASYIGH
jgi:hypothetical protein